MRVSPSRSAPGERERERSPPRGYSGKKLVNERAQGRRMAALAAVRIDVEVTLTCAEPRIGSRSVGFDEIIVRADAAIGVGRVNVLHTVIGARLVVVGVHVGHVGGVGEGNGSRKEGG